MTNTSSRVLRARGGRRNEPSGPDRVPVPEELADAYLRHGAAVYGLVRDVAGTAAADEVTVGAFVALGRTPHDLGADVAPSLGASLLAFAHRHAVHWLRSEPDRRSRLAAMPPTVIERMSWDRTNHRARDLLSKLSADERRSVVLAYFGGHDCRELAAILGQPEVAVKAQLRAGLRRLRGETDDAPCGCAGRSVGSS